MTFVKLSDPAKIDGKWRKQGETVEVSSDTAVDLEDQGLVAECPDDALQATSGDGAAAAETRTFSAAEWEAAVAAAARDLAGQAFDGALAKLEAEAKQLSDAFAQQEAEKTALLARVADAEARRDAADARIRDLVAEAEARASTSQPEDTPEPPAAKTAPKKGATAKG